MGFKNNKVVDTNSLPAEMTVSNGGCSYRVLYVVREKRDTMMCDIGISLNDCSHSLKHRLHDFSSSKSTIVQVSTLRLILQESFSALKAASDSPAMNRIFVAMSVLYRAVKAMHRRQSRNGQTRRFLIIWPL